MSKSMMARVAGAMAVAFTLACNTTSVTQTTGTVTVRVTSTGTPADTLFGISVDQGYLTYDVVAGQDKSFSVAAGTYLVELTGVASQCTVSGSNPREVTVTSATETPVDFAVTCGDDGVAKVTIATTGPDQDDQYTLYFDDGAKSVLVGPNQFVTVPLPSGGHTVALTGVAANCSVQGANPVSFAIPSSGVGEASFAVACSAK
jgi:hypothetical protein